MNFLKNIFNLNFYKLLVGILFIEIISYFGNAYPFINYSAFIIIILIALFLSIKNIKYGVWLVLLELFLGSKGYLFSLDFHGVNISIRIALWLIVMLVWLIKLIKRKSIFLEKNIWKKSELPIFLVLFIFISWGIISGIINGNSFSNIFFDANGWIYFGLIFPLYETILNKKLYQEKENSLLPILQIFILATLWLSLETYFLLFIFSHENLLISGIYHWVRDTGVGEITIMPSGFPRIFIQSQIFILIAVFLFFFALNNFWSEIKNNKKDLLKIILILSFLIGTIIISLSRSFWAGGVITFFIITIIIIKKYNWKTFIFTTIYFLLSIIIAGGLITAILKFPWPAPKINFNLVNTLSDRTQNEAASISRYSLLPKLLEKIDEAPLLGKGFGTSVTYQSSDPRVIKNNLNGQYTTYAFEWGWLDIWLKLGLLGAILYLFLLTKIMVSGFKKNNWLGYFFATGIILIAIINFFTPYLNHPLGISFLLLASAFIYKKD